MHTTQAHMLAGTMNMRSQKDIAMNKSQLAQFLANTTLGRDIEALATQFAESGSFNVQIGSFEHDLTPLLYDQGVTLLADKTEIAFALVAFLKRCYCKSELSIIAASYVGIKGRKKAWGYKGAEWLAFHLYNLQRRVYFAAGAGNVFR